MDWRIWRPVMAGLDTLHNVEINWSIDDVEDAHEALDIKAEAEEFAREKKA